MKISSPLLTTQRLTRNGLPITKKEKQADKALERQLKADKFEGNVEVAYIV